MKYLLMYFQILKITTHTSTISIIPPPPHFCSLAIITTLCWLQIIVVNLFFEKMFFMSVHRLHPDFTYANGLAIFNQSTPTDNWPRYEGDLADTIYQGNVKKLKFCLFLIGRRCVEFDVNFNSIDPCEYVFDAIDNQHCLTH